MSQNLFQSQSVSKQLAGESFEKDAIKIFCTLFLLFGLFYLPAIYYTLITAQHRMDEGKIMNMVPLDLTQPTMVNNKKEFLESFPVQYRKDKIQSICPRLTSRSVIFTGVLKEVTGTV